MGKIVQVEIVQSQNVIIPWEDFLDHREVCSGIHRLYRELMAFYREARKLSQVLQGLMRSSSFQETMREQLIDKASSSGGANTT